MKKKSKNRRWRLIADPKLQGMLCLRVTAYWILCQVTIFGTLFGFSFLDGSANGVTKDLMIPALITSAMILPVALFDMILFSNRFAGPILNIRRRFSELARGGVSDELRFRPGDYYFDLQDNFNHFCKQQNRSISPDVTGQTSSNTTKVMSN